MQLSRFGEPLVAVTLPDPTPGPGEVVVRVRACGVCRTDLKMCHGQLAPGSMRLPHVPGHEIAGEVVAVGPGVDGAALGMRAAVHFYVTCGACEFCRVGRENLCARLDRPGFERDGGYAELVRVPFENLVPIPPGLPFPEASILADAVATAYHAIKGRGRLAPGETCLVIGVGGLGVHAVQIARALGGRVIAADVDRSRLDLARRLGADAAIDAREDPEAAVRDLTGGGGAELTVNLVGPRCAAFGLASTKRGGRFCVVGYEPGRSFEIASPPFHQMEWEVLGCRASTRQDLRDVVDLVASGRVTPLVDRQFPLADANRALEVLESGAVVGRGVLVAADAA